MRIALSHRRPLVVFAWALFAGLATGAPAARAVTAVKPAEARPTLPFHLADQFVVGGEGGWGGLVFDAATHRLFISRSTTLQVVDTESRHVVGTMPCADGPHGIALAADLRRGFVSSGSDTSLAAFDLDSLAIRRTARLGPAGVGPIVYDPATHRVIVLAPDGTLTALDASTLEVVATHNLGARPAGAVSDGAGALFVALPELDAIAVLDARTLIERNRWPLESGASPAALAFDARNRRLFAAGKGLWFAVLEPEHGRVVARVPLGGGVESLVFDPERRLIATLGGGGASSTVWQQSADQYMVISTVGTSAGARMLALDPTKHVLYAAAAQLARTGRSSAPGAHPQMGIVPGSFTVYILAP